jgi:hypothetical protein
MKWCEVEEVVALKSDALIVDAYTLLLTSSVGQCLGLPGTAQGFVDVAKAIPRFLVGAMSYEDWENAIASSGPLVPSSCVVYKRE